MEALTQAVGKLCAGGLGGVVGGGGAGAQKRSGVGAASALAGDVAGYGGWDGKDAVLPPVIHAYPNPKTSNPKPQTLNSKP